jgi:hypothetical protein
LRFGRGVDNTRLIEEVGFQPRYDAVEAIRDLAEKSGGRRLGPSLHPGALAARAARLVGVR